MSNVSAESMSNKTSDFASPWQIVMGFFECITIYWNLNVFLEHLTSQRILQASWNSSSVKIQYFQISFRLKLRKRPRAHRGVFILLADAVSADDQVDRHVPAVLGGAHTHTHSQVSQTFNNNSICGAHMSRSPLTGRRIVPVWNYNTAPECERTWSCTAPGSAWSSPGRSAGWGDAALWAEEGHKPRHREANVASLGWRVTRASTFMLLISSGGKNMSNPTSFLKWGFSKTPQRLRVISLDAAFGPKPSTHKP